MPVVRNIVAKSKGYKQLIALEERSLLANVIARSRDSTSESGQVPNICASGILALSQINQPFR